MTTLRRRHVPHQAPEYQNCRFTLIVRVARTFFLKLPVRSPIRHPLVRPVVGWTIGLSSLQVIRVQ